MLLSLEERQAHLDLDEPCDEFGCTHSDYRAVLAWFLRTTCTRLGMKTGFACHACNNRKCGNPRHIYWGTAKENMADLKQADPEKGKRIRDAILATNPNHYTEMASKGGKGNLGRKNRSQAEVEAMMKAISHLDPNEWGFFTKIAKVWGMTSQHASRLYKENTLV